MDPSDRLRPALDGVACTACGASVPVESIRIVASRDALGVVEVACPTCGTVVVDVQVEQPAVSQADVDDMRRHLSEWRGDLLGLIDPR